MNRHIAALNITRVIIGCLIIIAVLSSPSLLSDACAIAGTVLWLFLPYVVKVEEVILRRLL